MRSDIRSRVLERARPSRRIETVRQVARARWELARRRALSSILRTRVAQRMLTARGYRVVHCFGDSHTRIFEEVARRRLLPRAFFDVEVVRGGTAYGLGSLHSKTGALQRFRRAIDRLPSDAELLFLMGEVDCGYLIWSKAARDGTDLDHQLDRSLRNYLDFLEGLVSEGRSRLIVAAVPPPTIQDGPAWEGSISLRREITATERERALLTMRYNAALRAWCAARPVTFLDFEPDVIDTRTGLVLDRFRNPDPRNHHLAPAAFGPVLARRLQKMGPG